MRVEFPVSIDSSQIWVGSRRHASSALRWTCEHVAQGFAWSEGHVAFGVPDHDGECRIEAELAPAVAEDPSTLWAVQVPFSVEGPIEIGALFDRRVVAVPDGRYALTYQAFSGTDGYAYVLRLTFSPCATPEFRILRTGGDITSEAVLTRDAELI